MEGILKMRVSHRKYGGQEGAAQTSDLFYLQTKVSSKTTLDFKTNGNVIVGQRT